MFHCAAKLLTLLSVMFHAGFGCCAHHDHCSVVKSYAEAVEKQSDHHCSCGFHAHGSTESKSEKAHDSAPSSCPCGESHEGCTDHCSWLTNSKVEMPTNVGFACSAFATAAWSTYASQAALIASRFADAPQPLSDSMETLRAKNQVWRL